VNVKSENCTIRYKKIAYVAVTCPMTLTDFWRSFRWPTYFSAYSWRVRPTHWHRADVPLLNGQTSGWRIEPMRRGVGRRMVADVLRHIQ